MNIPKMTPEEALRYLPKVEATYNTPNFTKSSYTAQRWFATVCEALEFKMNYSGFTDKNKANEISELERQAYARGYEDGFKECEIELSKNADSERLQGKWVMVTVSDEKGGWKKAPVCNRCSCRKPDNIGQTFSNNFCTNCCADMRGGKE